MEWSAPAVLPLPPASREKALVKRLQVSKRTRVYVRVNRPLSPLRSARLPPQIFSPTISFPPPSLILCFLQPSSTPLSSRSVRACALQGAAS
jgi:hypothetical protein